MREIALLMLVLGWMLHPVVAQQQNTIEFSHLFDGTFSSQGIHNINWMQDGRYYTTLARASDNAELRKYDVISGEFEVLLTSSSLKVEGRDIPIQIQDYQFSADETKLLIKTDVESIWRRSTRENYYVHDLETGATKKLTKSNDKQQYAQFSPEGNKVAFVQDNNLYLVDLLTGEEKAITTDGEVNKIINGATDWVYEEEFGFAKAWYWSPDGQKIAYYRFDETRVKEFFMTEWGDLYPGQTRFKYPKAGEENSIVNVGVYDLESGKTTWIDIGSDTDQYIPRINWTRDSDLLAIRRMNRLQNRQDLMLSDVSSGESRTIKTETSDAWIDVNDNLTFLENGGQFIYTSEEDGYNHIYLYDMDGELIRQVTRGDWEVTNFLGYDEKSKILYYISTESSPLERHLYSVGIDGNNKKKLSNREGWHSANMSPDYQYYIKTYSAPDIPPEYILYEENAREVRILEDNARLKERMSEYQLPEKEYITVTLPETDLNGYILKPFDFDSSVKYPVLFFVYGGPGSQTVEKSFDFGQQSLWHYYLTTKGYVIVSVDNRGTGGRGRNFEKQLYKKLGQLEIEDQIASTKYLAEEFSFIDADRIGIWGWSYGGYMASLGISKGHKTFKTAVAVAPVTSWRFYDTIYTERFMQTPQMNAEGYKKGSPMTYAGQIKGNYLLVHGTGDDNVHFQNTVEFVNALIEQGIQFETMYYPDRNHGIYGGNTRYHLFTMLTDFILDNL